ncbi:MAG: substrate-binding domain-containing protein [Vulcanisaeta sp.]
MTNWKLISIGLIIVVVALAAVAGYFASIKPKTVVVTTPTPTTNKTIVIFYFNPAPANFWYNLVTQGVQAAVQQLRSMGYNVVYEEFDATTVSQQISELEQAAALHPNIIVIGTVTDAVQGELLKLKQEGVIVILVDRDVPNKAARNLYLGTNNTLAAEIELESFLSYLRQQHVPTPWKFVIVTGLPGVETLYLRTVGFEDVLQPLVQNGTAQILTVVQANQDDQAQAYATISSIVPKYGTSVTAYLDSNLLTAIANVEALEADGIGVGFGPGKVPVLGFDAQLPEWLALIQNGTVLMTIQQTPFVMGYWAVWAGYYIYTGQLNLPANATINTPTYIVVSCNATYSMILDHIAPPPTYLLLLAQQLTPQNPAIQAPPYYAYDCQSNSGLVPPPPALYSPWPVPAGSDQSFVATGFH